MKKLRIETLPRHHAILVIAEDRQNTAETLWQDISGETIPHQFIHDTVLDIGRVRELITWSNTPFSGEKRAIISFHTMTLPAQNAMLKVLEDPHDGVSFILVTSNKRDLIPTVLSRVYEIEHSQGGGHYADEVQIFLKTKQGERMKLPCVTQLLSQEDEEGRKDRESVRGFLSTLVTHAKDSGVEPKKILSLLEMEQYATDPSASGKMLLEYVALLLPQVK